MEGMESPLPGPTEHGWYVACESRRLGRRPLAVSLLDRPLVLFRDGEGRPAALADCCPHRNVPLSLGRVHEGRLECAYHGWRFERGGQCVGVPGLVDGRPSSARRAVAHAVREQDGFVWVWGRPDAEPVGDPFRFPGLGERGTTTVRRAVEAEAPLADVAENGLDVPHTAYLHGGLFRSPRRDPREIEVVVRRWPDRIEAEYLGERRPTGWAARLLAPGGGTVEHFDRFVLPSIVQVDYRLGPVTRFCVTAALTPLSARRTRLFAVVSFRLPVPGGLVVPFLGPLAMRIFRQDAAMLARQTANVDRFGGRHYRHTEVDVLGPGIHRLLRSAADGPPPEGGEPVIRRLRMRT